MKKTNLISICSSFILAALFITNSCKKEQAVSPVSPILVPVAVTGITSTTAISGGDVTSSGGSLVTARGVCWSTVPAPTIADSKTSDGTGTGSFISSISGLTANAEYYVRAYATNSAGTGYSAQVTFTTLPIRYKQVVFSTTASVTDIPYGSNVSFMGVPTTLKLDFYAPDGDTATNRPLLILLPGGGFSVLTDKATTGLPPLAKQIAQYGYAVAVINYRVYDGPDTVLSNAAFKQLVLQGMQDAKAAIRFFRKDAATTNTYKINPNKIILGGHSAGSLLALHSVYLDEVTKADAAFQSIIQSNGGLEGTSGNSGYSSSVSGVLNMAGALLDKNYITATGKPLENIYGTADDFVPFNDGVLTVADGSYVSFDPIAVSGSNSLNTQANSVGVNSSEYVISGGDHFAPIDPLCIGCIDAIITFMYGLL